MEYGSCRNVAAILCIDILVSDLFIRWNRKRCCSHVFVGSKHEHLERFVWYIMRIGSLSLSMIVESLCIDFFHFYHGGTQCLSREYFYSIIFKYYWPQQQTKHALIKKFGAIDICIMHSCMTRSSSVRHVIVGNLSTFHDASRSTSQFPSTKSIFSGR